MGMFFVAAVRAAAATANDCRPRGLADRLSGVRLARWTLAILFLACRGGDKSAPAATTTNSSTSASATEASEDADDELVPQRDLDAVDQPSSHRVVFQLRAGERYAIAKRGGPGKAWCKLRVGGVDGWVECAAGGPGGASPSGSFAYYVMSLSWSPAFCETPAGARSPEQCASGRPYAFVVHGLWPQNERGWPEHCASANAGPSATLTSKMLDIMPSPKLVAHEWETHGTCSGLSADDYFAHVRSAFSSIHVPPAYVAPKEAFTSDAQHLVAAFLAANPHLRADAIAVRCKREIEEVRICLDRDLAPRACSSDVRGACPGSFTVPPVR